MRYKIKLCRWLGDGSEINRKNWKELISSLVLAGYTLYIGGNEDEFVIFETGDEDLVEAIEE